MKLKAINPWTWRVLNQVWFSLHTAVAVTYRNSQINGIDIERVLKLLKRRTTDLPGTTRPVRNFPSFSGERLSWFSSGNHFNTLTFVPLSSIIFFVNFDISNTGCFISSLDASSTGILPSNINFFSLSTSAAWKVTEIRRTHRHWFPILYIGSSHKVETS